MVHIITKSLIYGRIYPNRNYYRISDPFISGQYNGYAFEKDQNRAGNTNEGKVLYEELEQHVAFFESALRKAYANDALGGCLMITIG